MSREFYSRRTRAFAIMTWVFGGMYGLGFIKILAFDMLNGHCLRPEIKRLELRIAELTETLQGK